MRDVCAPASRVTLAHSDASMALKNLANSRMTLAHQTREKVNKGFEEIQVETVSRVKYSQSPNFFGKSFINID